MASLTRMRLCELLGLHWRDVDLTNRRVYLRETENGSLRVLMLNDFAVQVLNSLPDRLPSDLVLSDVNPARLSVHTRHLFQGAWDSGDFFHSLRHTAASWLVMSSVDLYAGGQLLGHKTPRLTQRYAHPSPDYMAGAMGRLDSVFSGVLNAGTALA